MSSLALERLPSSVITRRPFATMNIRLARVSATSWRVIYSEAELSQVDDLQGMQACNLHNLPENYTLKYCRRTMPLFT